jgi:hypothetical protein
MSDQKFTISEWQRLYKDPKTLIVQASVKNGSDSWQPFPIGMCWGYTTCDVNSQKLQIGEHEKTVFCGVNPTTDACRRGQFKINRDRILQTLYKNNIVNEHLSVKDYFEQLPNYKFVISPEGNGIDCHRHYEALLAGCIPVMEKNPLIEEKYKGLPILYTSDYSEINEQFLQRKYLDMKDRTYDFSRLFLSFYSDEEQELIRDCGNHWVNIITKKTYYP